MRVGGGGCHFTDKRRHLELIMRSSRDGCQLEEIFGGRLETLCSVN